MSGNRFEGKVAIITGAAWGMGFQHATRLSEEGASVVLLDIQAERVVDSASKLPRSLGIPCDVTRADQVAAALEQAASRFGGIDILVNNAGGSLAAPRPLWELPEDYYDRVLALNLKAHWLCVRAALPAMRSRGGGKVINIASFAPLIGSGGMAAYAGAKMGVIGQTRSMAAELGPLGINVNAIAPGLIDVPHEKVVFSREDFEKTAADHIARQAIKRVGTPNDISGAVLYLASSDSDFMAGQVLIVDGGHGLFNFAEGWAK
jgi:3-oxoacyl-[acyl-carrier protein] reductase